MKVVSLGTARLKSWPRQYGGTGCVSYFQNPTTWVTTHTISIIIYVYSTLETGNRHDHLVKLVTCAILHLVVGILLGNVPDIDATILVS